ncbi:RNA polymerase I-specific transcription initiation factor RRN3-like [Gigantopelta aegis]|uniref:RNA polymerase I-specific transcription initiation factor RRN3-like n=1 Tax=Gigantopelta aegis TaxID=1735272 RepID=UPI001B88AD83|nr:RNA polymerase I-specific transcription initiation factor RRN3-like [Gigantopelta aegis]
MNSSMKVADIIEAYNTGTRKEYDIFLSKLAYSQIESSKLVLYLRELRECISLLDKDHEILVGLLLKVDWPDRETKVVKEYQLFFLNLMSAHTSYLQAGLKMIVKHFWAKCDKKHKPDKESRMKDSLRFGNVHKILSAVVKIVPMTPTLLIPLLVKNFPFIMLHTYCQECYVRNLLEITKYIPQERKSILDIIVDRMINIDVHASREDINAAEGNEEEEMEEDSAIFDMDDSGLCEDGECSPKMSHEMANKLDVLMNIVLGYIQSECCPTGQLAWEATKKLYKEFLYVFDRTILPTTLNHVQFIMFYLCSFKQPICEGFIDYLWKKFQDPNTQTIFRQSAVGYIGSLLSRATFISVSTLKVVINLMVTWIHGYLDQASADAVQADITRHRPFYSACQAVFYVFCFRQKEIFEMKKGYKWAESLNFQRIVTSRLNPLRVCLPIVVKTFASLTRMHQIAFCDTIIQKNERCMLPMLAPSTSYSDSTEVSNLLDFFFPFDPYLLVRSRSYIAPFYREYSGSLQLDEEKADTEEEDDFLPKETVPDVPIPDFTSGKSTTDFMQYGVSPGFKNL